MSRPSTSWGGFAVIHGHYPPRLSAGWEENDEPHFPRNNETNSLKLLTDFSGLPALGSSLYSRSCEQNFSQSEEALHISSPIGWDVVHVVWVDSGQLPGLVLSCVAHDYSGWISWSTQFEAICIPVLGFFLTHWCWGDNGSAFYQHGLTLIPAWIRNHVLSKEWDEITYQFPNCAAVAVWGPLINFIPHLQWM